MSFITFSVHQFVVVDQIRVDGMVGTRNSHGTDNKRVQDVSRRSQEEQYTWEAYA
jgi:hypothetical protein